MSTLLLLFGIPFFWCMLLCLWLAYYYPAYRVLSVYAAVVCLVCGWYVVAVARGVL